MTRYLQAVSLVILSIILPSVFATDSIRHEVASMAKDVGKEVFSDVERRVLEEYMARRGIEPRDYDEHRSDEDDEQYRKSGKHKDKNKAHKHVKARTKGLPPGIEKKLARGGALPPGIAKTRLPNDVEKRLPPVKDGYQRYVSADKVILVEQATGIISDLINDVGEHDEPIHSQTNRDGLNKRSDSKRSEENINNNHSKDTLKIAEREPADQSQEKSWWQFWK